MCLAIPGKVMELLDEKTAKVDFNGLTRKVNISLVSVNIGDYIVVHTGFAIGVLNKDDIKDIDSYFKESDSI